MILIIGSGRTATHFSHYFHLLEVPFQTWSRRQNSPESLVPLLKVARRVLLLISDSELQNFINLHASNFKGTWLHMSGALEIPEAIGLHPLMTFGANLYDFEFYKRIPFVMRDGQNLHDFLPELPNPSFEISPENRPRYHALCVFSGNFTTLLWLEAIKGFESMGLPREIALPYMTKIFENLVHASGLSPLTGPLARKDQYTVKSNLQSLEGTPLKDLYLSFVKTYFPEYSP